MRKYRFFTLSIVLLIADQVTKLLVVRSIPPYSVAWQFAGDFFRLIHVRNHGVAFSMGSGFPDAMRTVLFIVLPMRMIIGRTMNILIGVALYLLKGKDLTDGQRWTLAAIVGGGMGNQIDRIFRPDGVVDFLDFKFYGLFGLERWPTFNIADASLVVSSVMLVLLMILQERAMRKS